jgi:hypothetical protein
MDAVESACRELVEQILRKEVTNEKELNKAKKDLSSRYKLSARKFHDTQSGRRGGEKTCP